MPSAASASSTASSRGTERGGVQPQHEEVVAVPRAVRRTHLRVEAGHCPNAGRQIPSIRLARPGLLLETIELAVQHGALKLAQAVVARDHVVLVPDAARHAAAVLDRATRRGQRLVVGRDDAAFAGGQVLARLEGERGQVADRARGTALGSSPRARAPHLRSRPARGRARSPSAPPYRPADRRSGPG